MFFGILGAARFNQLSVESARAQTAQVQAEASLTKAELEARQRELSMLALPQLRRSIRRMDWFPKSWEHIRSLRGGGTSPDPELQGQAAAASKGSTPA